MCTANRFAVFTFQRRKRDVKAIKLKKEQEEGGREKEWRRGRAQPKMILFAIVLTHVISHFCGGFGRMQNVLRLRVSLVVWLLTRTRDFYAPKLTRNGRRNMERWHGVAYDDSSSNAKCEMPCSAKIKLKKFYTENGKNFSSLRMSCIWVARKKRKWKCMSSQRKQ